MKKSRVVIIVAAAVIVACAGFIAGMMARESIAGGNNEIGMDAAKEIALSSVGVSAEKATFTKTEADENSYEIDFYTEANEYDFEINRETGAIVEREVSPRALVVPEETSAADPYIDVQDESSASSQPASENKNDNDVIGTDAAKQAALNHAGLTSASFISASLDYDDGVRVYDVEFSSGNKEYEYEINAYTGDIMSCDIDRRDYDD